jgi:hypothetical protein
MGSTTASDMVANVLWSTPEDAVVKRRSNTTLHFFARFVSGKRVYLVSYLVWYMLGLRCTVMYYCMSLRIGRERHFGSSIPMTKSNAQCCYSQPYPAETLTTEDGKRNVHHAKPFLSFSLAISVLAHLSSSLAGSSHLCRCEEVHIQGQSFLLSKNN